MQSIIFWCVSSARKAYLRRQQGNTSSTSIQSCWLNLFRNAIRPPSQSYGCHHLFPLTSLVPDLWYMVWLCATLSHANTVPPWCQAIKPWQSITFDHTQINLFPKLGDHAKHREWKQKVLDVNVLSGRSSCQWTPLQKRDLKSSQSSWWTIWTSSLKTFRFDPPKTIDSSRLGCAQHAGMNTWQIVINPQTSYVALSCCHSRMSQTTRICTTLYKNIFNKLSISSKQPMSWFFNASIPQIPSKGEASVI